MTLRNGSTGTTGESAALRVFAAVNEDVRVQNVAVLSSHNTNTSPDIFTNVVTVDAHADVYFINNIIADCTGHYANLGIFVDSSAQTVFMHNNTLALGGAGFGALLDSQAGTAFRLVNNAIVGDLAFNSRNSSDPIRLWLYSNLGYWGYDPSVTAPVVQADVGNDGNIDPRFSGTLDFHPAAGSPLVNRGLNAPYGGSSPFDIDAKPRVDLGIVDVGAYESTQERIFANGFN